MSDNAQRKNAGKVELSRNHWVAEYEEAKVWQFGSIKYQEKSRADTPNWEKLWGDETIAVALDSMMRHVNAVRRGELFDPESSLPHMAHVRCNAAMILKYMYDQGMLNPLIYDANEPHAEGVKETERDTDKATDFKGGPL